MPIDPKILSVQPGADRANAGEADPRSMLSFDLATPDTAPDEWQRAAARRVSEAVGLPDPDGRVWKGKPFATGAEYLGFMRGMLKSGDVWEYAATDELKAFEAADDAGRAAIARAALGMADRAAERAGRAMPEGYGFADGAPELQEAPEDVLAANARLRADGEAAARHNAAAPSFDGTFRPLPERPEAAADRKTLDAWRARRADEALVNAHREKLLRDNLWAAWLSVTPSLSGRAKEIATGLFRGGTIRGEDIADFQRLDETEQAAVARLARLSRNPAAGTLLNTLGDAGIGFINGVATLPLNAVKQIDTLTTSIDQAVFGKDAGLIDNAEMNRRARTEQRLREALDDPAGIDPSGADHGYPARSLVGAVSTLPYMGYASMGGMGVAAVALDFMQRLDDRIAADGGDVHGQGVEWAARKAVWGALYAGVESISALPVFKDAGDIALKTAFLKLATRHGWAAAEKVAAHWGKETFKETLEESVQAVIEEHAASVGLGRGPGWADAARAGVREFAETAGTMGFVALAGTARQGVQTRSVRGRAELADFTAAALRREAFILSDNPYAGRGDAESVGRSWTVAAETLDGYRSDWAGGGQAALDKRADLTPEQAAVLGHVFEGEREGREAGEFILGRNLAARVDADATGAVYEELDAERVRGIVTEAGADAEARLAEMGFTEAGAARVAGYVRKEAALGNRFARVLGDIRESLARDLEADPERSAAQAAAAGRMLEIQPLREVYQRAGTRQGAVKAFKELRFTQEQAENLAAAFDEERAFAASPEAAAAWRAAYLDASREATPGERLRRMTGFEARPAPEAGEGASLLTLRGPDGKPRGEILLQPDTAETFDPESRFAGEAVEQASAGKPWAVTERQWQAFTPEQRRAYAAEYIRPRGGFTVTDPADPSVSADGAQADILTGKITLDPEAPSATLYHEAAHAWLAVMRRAGKITEADIAKLREAYGPSAADPQWFNEEALADDIREIGAETDYAPDKPLARRFIDAVRRLAGAARAEESRRTAASGARQALYESIVYGKPFEGVGDFEPGPAAAGQAAPTAADPLGGATTAQAATGDGQQETGDKQPETRNQKPETRNPEPETKNQKPEAGRWTAATPQGNLRVGGHWVIAPRDRFISDTDPRYDFSLQNRTRDAALGSAEQVAEIVAKFDALRLLDSPDTANGAPVAIPLTLKNADGKNETFYMVLSGNGRFRALDKLDADNRGDEYRKPVQAFADERGIPYDPADMTQDARPRLARVMTLMPVGATNQRIAELSNQNAVLQMTDAERAYSDAALIERDGTADLYAANRDGLPSRNGSDAFFAWFTRAAGDASLMDSQGRPTDAARARARRAMLALAVGRGRRGKETVMAFTEQAEALGLDRQRDALLMSAGALSALGEAKPDYALADEMSRAAADLLLLARERKAGKAVTAAEFIAQGDMLDAMPPAAAEALRILDAARPAEGIAAAFQRYADLAAKIDTDTDDMFGEAPAAKDALLRQAVADTDVKAPAGPRYSIALAARRYALATRMPAEGEKLIARQLEFLFARHMDPAYIASRARATETRRAKAAAAERRKAEARRDAHGRALANPDDPQAWAEAFAASDDGTVSRVAHDFFMGGGGPQRFPHAYGGKPLYGTRVNTPRDAAALLMPLRNPYQESFKAIFLDDKRRVLGAEVCTLGLLDSAPVHPRETFRRGIELGASQVILSHNHPSGDPRPSKEDRDITRRLDEAAKLIGLQYIEHIITDGGKYYSLASESLEELAGPGQAAWEAAAAGETRHIREPQTVAALARALRQGAENVIHAVMLDTHNRITAVKRIPFDPARIADPAYQDETVTREALRAAVANPTAAIILEVTDRAVTAYAAQGLHARAESQARAVGIQLHDTLYRQGGWSWSVKEGARVMPLEADAAAEPAAPRYSLAVTPEQDAAYMRAVEAGDMETAQRMVEDAAKQAGYTIEAWHATDAYFTVFDRSRLGQTTLKNSPPENALRLARLGFWFHEKPLSKQTLNKRDMRVFLQLENADRKSFDELWDNPAFDGDSVVVNDTEFNGTSYVVRHPSQIKSADIVLRDDAGRVIPLSERFNAASPDIRYSVQTRRLETLGLPDGLAEVSAGTSVAALSLAVTPARDAEYMAAVESGDMEKAQAMVDEAAKRAGYDVEGWHGTRSISPITEFRTSREGKEEAIFFSDSKDEAVQFPYPRGSASSVRARLKGNFAEVNAHGELYEPDVMERWIRDAREAGKDGVHVRNIQNFENGARSDTYAVFKPNQIKSADPVTYDDQGNVIPLSQRFNEATPDIRYALDLTGRAYSKENLLVGFMAHAELTGRGFPSRGTVAALAEKIGLENHRYDDLARRARALAASTEDDAIRKAAASADTGNAAYAIGELARRAERALVRAGAAEGAKLALNEGRIRTLSEAGVAAAMRAVTGADYADIETDTDIDIAASILAADPKAFDEQRERARAEAASVLPGAPADADPAAPADPAARALPETDEDAPELTDRQRAEIARKRREREARIQALLDAARDRAARNRFRDEERRRRKAANEKAEAEEEAAAAASRAGAAGGTDAASAPAPAAPGAEETGPAAPVDFSDRWEAAAFLRVWAFDRFRRDNPNRRDTQGDLSKNLVAVEFYRKTAVRELTDLARKLLEPGAPRETVRAMIGEIVTGLSANLIERKTARVFGVLNKHAVRERQRSLVKRFQGEIKRQFIKGKEFEELGVDIDRALTGAIEEDARYIMRVCELSDRALDGETSALQDERNRLEAIIAQREGMTDEAGKPLDVGKDDMASRRALRQLALLDKYGAMVDMMPGEILDLTGDALATLGREAVALRERWAEYDKLVKSIRDPLARSIARGADDPAASESVWNAVADSQLSMLRQRLDFLTRYEKDPAKREAARAAISDLMNLLAEGNVEYTNAVADDRAALMGALGQIFRRDDGRPDRKKIRAYLRRLDERVPRELAARLTRQGRQNAMTYGQMLHLLAYLDQWASYRDNIIRHDRRGQAALIRSFVFEDPKTGEARRALTNEDTQLVEWLRRAHYAGKRGAISAVTRRLAGREIDSPDPLYHPVKMLLSRTSALAAAPGGAAWQPMAGAFSRRVRNSLDVDETASILDLFHSRSHDTAVLTAFGERGLVIREILTSRGFQDAVRRFHGDRALSKILRQVAQSLDGGRARGGGQSAAASMAQRLTTYMYLGFNPHSAAKQTASLPVFAARLGFRRLGSILFSPIDWQAVTRLKESDEYRARYGTGPASGMNAADRAAYDAPDADPLKKVFGDWGLWMTRKADWAISAWVGQGVYRDLKATYIDRGMAEAEADRRAISETFTLIEETQQSGRAENLPELSREHGFLGRLMVQFATSPLQQMQYELKELAEWRDLAANGGTEQSIREARNKFMRALFINHVIVPGIMTVISNLYQFATGDEPDWKKEGYWQTLLIAAIMGQFGRIFFAGALAEQTLRVLFLRKPPYMGQLVPAEGVIRFAGNLAYPVRDIVTWDTEHMQADLMRLLKSVALTRLPVKVYERAAGDE